MQVCDPVGRLFYQIEQERSLQFKLKNMNVTNIQLFNMGTVNKNRVCISRKDDRNITLWFSYETIVAFRIGGDDPICRENDWSTTTGKLLNEIEPDKSKRIAGEEFEKKLSEIFNS